MVCIYGLPYYHGMTWHVDHPPDRPAMGVFPFPPTWCTTLPPHLQLISSSQTTATDLSVTWGKAMAVTCRDRWLVNGPWPELQ